MHKNKADKTIFENMRAQIDLLNDAVHELEVLELALEIRSSLKGDPETVTVIEEPEPGDGCDFEGPGVLLVAIGGKTDLITLDKTDRVIGGFSGPIGLWHPEGLPDSLPVIGVFDNDNASETDDSLVVTGECLLCAMEGIDLRPLTGTEICILHHYVLSHTQMIDTPEGKRPALVIR